MNLPKAKGNPVVPKQANLLVLLAIGGLALASNTPAHAQTPAELTFALSPSTNKHVALQPRQDYHRVHFLVRARGLQNKQCEAVLVCTTGGLGPLAGEIVRSIGYFMPNTNDQTFSVYLRTPKLFDRTAHYYLWVRVTDPWSTTVATERTAYHWSVLRDQQGSGTVQGQAAGTTIELVEQVARAVPDDGDAATEFRIVFETRTRSIAVPEGFEFGVVDAANEVYEIVRPLN